MRQTVRTNNAAVVAEGAVKPTSVYTVNKVPNSLVVVAHLSEAIPRFWLIDQVSLETFVSNELEYGLRLAVEAKVLADVNGTSGIQTQAYATSVLATLRKWPDQAGGRRLHAGMRSCCTRPTGRASSWRCRASRRWSTWPALRPASAVVCSASRWSCPTPGGRRRSRGRDRCRRAGLGHPGHQRHLERDVATPTTVEEPDPRPL